MDITWILIGVAGMLFLIFMFKSQDLIFLVTLIKKNLFYVILLAVVLFFAFSITQIHNTYSTNLTTPGGILQTGKLFFVWFGGVVGNVGKLSGYAIHQNWFNVTNTTHSGL